MSQNLIQADWAMTGISRLVTVADHEIPGAIGKLRVVKHGALAARAGRIVWVGPEEALPYHVDSSSMASENRLDARGSAVLPGFVDSHTHFAFAGDRAPEFWLRHGGVPGEVIVQQGGGIMSTVRATRAASFDELRSLALYRLKNFLEYGTTTVEGKTGYGLNLATEAKCLDIMNELAKQPGLPRIVPTFLGAHVVPPEYANIPDGGDAYVEFVCSELLPRFAKQAQFCDVFCDRTAFTVAQTQRVLEQARGLGYALKLHADQTSRTGGSRLAAKFHVMSADHLDYATDKDLELLCQNGVVATLLPGCSFSSFPWGRTASKQARRTGFPSAARFLDAGLRVALATDFNPGTSYCENMQAIIAFAVNLMGMPLEDALHAATLGGAWALGMEEEVGSLEVGKRCDLVVLRCPHEQELGYHFGGNLVARTVVGGMSADEVRTQVSYFGWRTGRR